VVKIKITRELAKERIVGQIMLVGDHSLWAPFVSFLVLKYFSRVLAAAPAVAALESVGTMVH
jgi:hypothetical protein